MGNVLVEDWLVELEFWQLFAALVVVCLTLLLASGAILMELAVAREVVVSQ